MTPSADVKKILFSGSIDTALLRSFDDDLSFMNYGGFKEIGWLNTPGPIYTTYTDNCGTGQVEAMNNVGGDEDYHEVIFKQPSTRQELEETLTAAAIDPFAAYYFDGNANWTAELIIQWWSESDKRVEFIISLYHNELNLPDILDRPFCGPREPIPENYKNWLDFYQRGMKEYLEWYIYTLTRKQTTLSKLIFNWTAKNELDTFLKSKKNSR